MTEESKIRSNSTTAGAFLAPQIAANWQPYMQEALGEIQKATTAWIDRNQEAVRSNLKALQALSTCKDPASFTIAWSEWLTSTMGRFASETTIAADHALRLADIGQKSVMCTFRFESTAAEQSAANAPQAGTPAGPKGRAKIQEALRGPNIN